MNTGKNDQSLTEYDSDVELPIEDDEGQRWCDDCARETAIDDGRCSECGRAYQIAHALPTPHQIIGKAPDTKTDRQLDVLQVDGTTVVTIRVPRGKAYAAIRVDTFELLTALGVDVEKLSHG